MLDKNFKKNKCFLLKKGIHLNIEKIYIKLQLNLVKQRKKLNIEI